MKYLLQALMLVALSTPALAEDTLKYYMNYEDALNNTPKTRTEYFSKELERDFTNWPQPWNVQVRNAITNAGGSATQDHIGGKEYWVPFDKIPGEETFPMMKRLNLNAQRGYQEAIIYDYVEFEKMQAEFSAEIKSIADKRNAESKKELQKVVDFGAELLAKSERRRKARAAEEKRLKYYENRCAEFFPKDGGGCGTLAFSIVHGGVQKVSFLEASSLGEEIITGDVFVTTPWGRLVARDDQHGWVQWYRYDKATSDVIYFSEAK